MARITDIIREFLRKGDVLLLTLCLIASAFGLVLIYSATRYDPDLHSNVLKQFVFICVGVVAYVVMSFVDIELFTERTWKWMFLFNVFIIVLLLTPFGVGEQTTGNNSWLAFPSCPLTSSPPRWPSCFLCSFWPSSAPATASGASAVRAVCCV